MNSPEHTVEDLLQSKYEWLGQSPPESFFEFAKQNNCTVLTKQLPIDANLFKFVNECNTRHEERLYITPKMIVERSQHRAQGFLWRQAIRHIGEPAYKLTGYEDLYIGLSLLGLVDNPNAIRLTMALSGLNAEQLDPDLIKNLLDYKLSGFTLGGLETFQTILGAITRPLSVGMRTDSPAYQWSRANRDVADQLPDALKKMYYLQDVQGYIKEVYAVLQLTKHPALEQPDWKRTEQLANLHKEEIKRLWGRENNPDLTSDDLRRGRLIMKLLSQSNHPLLGALLHTPDPTP